MWRSLWIKGKFVKIDNFYVIGKWSYVRKKVFVMEMRVALGKTEIYIF